MKVVAYLNATIIRFTSLEEYLPEQAGSLMPYAQGIAARYSFSSMGESQAAANVGVIAPAFHSGLFDFEGKQVPVISLEFLPGRINVVCTTSEQASAFFDDLLGFLKKDFGFRAPDREVKTFTSSAIVVDFGDKFLDQISVAANIVHALNESLASVHATRMYVQGLRCAGSVDVGSGLKVGIHYALEERANRPAGTNWLFSQAPLATKAHEALLNEIASIVSANK